MKILVIGSGGREHALVWALRRSPDVTSLFCAPGNPGIAEEAQLVPIKPTDIEGLLEFALREQVDLTVVGPEQPLADGIVDTFRAQGLRIFGPSKAAAELEWSKAFAKDFMKRHGIPTASYRTYEAAAVDEAKAYLSSVPLPVVLKADGLAAGKGVVVCRTREEATTALEQMVTKKVFGGAANRIVIEEFLDGEEASVFAVSDGQNFVTLAPAQDHKRVYDGDRGKNTGGMGAYAPTPVVSDALLQDIEQAIVRKTIDGMAKDGRTYTGCLYVGLMLTNSGPKVVEYNCRFGDPEAQVVLPLYGGDLAALLKAACDKTITASLKRSAVMSGAAVCVVVASEGYPDQYTTGYRIDGLEYLESLDNVIAFHAGTAWDQNELVTHGGRVLGITAIQMNGNLLEAISNAYKAVDKVSFAGMHFRRDIGKKALLH